MTNDIKDWSTTPASNDIADPGINWQEGMAPSAVNNSARGMMAAVKTWWDESLGGISAHATDTGVADAYVIAPAPAITTYAAGQAFHFFAVNANTGAATVNVNGLGVKAIQLNSAALVSGDIGAGDLVRVVYDGTQFQLPGLPTSLSLTDLTVDTDTLYVDAVNGYVGISTNNPDNIVHVMKTSNARAWAVDANDIFIIEHNLSASCNFITEGNGGILFSDQTARAVGAVQYNHPNNELRVTVNGTQYWTFTTTGNLNVISGSLEFAGNAALPINQLTTLGANSFDQTVDSLLLWDNSAAAHKQVKLQDFGLTVITQAATQTFALADANSFQLSSSAGAVTWTVPPNSSVAFEIGTVIQIFQSGAGQVTIAPGSGVTLRAPNGTKTSQQYGVACVAKVVTDVWVIYGDVAA